MSKEQQNSPQLQMKRLVQKGVMSIFLKIVITHHMVATDDDVVLRHTLPVFYGLGWCPIVNWDFAGTVSIFGPDALPDVHQ